MKIRKIRVKGTVPSPGELVFDASLLGDAPVVAIIGANGSGKTALMETCVGAPHRVMPSRGSVAEIATGPDTELDVIYELEPGRIVGFHLNIDATKTPRTMAGWVNGGDRLPGEKAQPVTKYDSEVAKLLPPLSTYLASAFGAQNGAGRFLDELPAKRREVLARLIGAERWQERAVKAGEKGRAVEKAKAVADGKRAEAANRVDGGAADLARAKGDEEAGALSALMEAEAVNERRKAARAEYDAQAAALKADEAITTEKGKALRAAHDLACSQALEGWQSREVKRKADLAASIEEARRLAKALADVHASEHRAWKMHADGHKANIAQAQADVARLEDAAARLAKVPCGGAGEFASCALIATAVKAKGEIAEATAKRDALAAFVLYPEPIARHDSPEIVAALARRDAMAIEEAKPGTPTEPGELAEARAALVAIRAKIAALIAPAAEVDVAGLRMRADALARDVARLTEVARQSEAAKKQAEEAADEVARLAIEEDDWRTLQEACGPRGIQAFLVDAAAPEITATCNDLLHACYGPRYSVRLSTQAANAKGGVKEVCDLTVLDGERGTDGSAALKSGGERVILGEALALAIAIYHKRRSAIPMLDLIRDECAGALDGENARAYVSMLRKAIEIGGFARCYFVSHVPELWALADARVRVADGKVEVEA